MLIFAWREFDPSSHSYAADAWILKRDKWWWRLPVELTCLGVTNWFADRQQAQSTKATSAADKSSAINIHATSSDHVPPAHPPTVMQTDSAHSSYAAQLVSHAGAIAAILASLAAPQQTAADESHQQASPTQFGGSQVQLALQCLIASTGDFHDVNVRFCLSCYQHALDHQVC